MKKVKIAFWGVLLVLIGLLVYQNWDFFSARKSLGIDLYFTQGQTPELANLIFFAAFFAAGLLIAYISSLFERFKLNKTIKDLKNQERNHQTVIAEMRKEVQALKKPAEQTEPPRETEDTPVESTETDNVQPSHS